MMERQATPGLVDASCEGIDLLVVGDLNVDMILTGHAGPTFGQIEKIVDDATLTLGGSGAILACAAARLGLRVALVAAVGDDLFGRYAIRELVRLGVSDDHIILRDDCSTGVTCVF